MHTKKYFVTLFSFFILLNAFVLMRPIPAFADTSFSSAGDTFVSSGHPTEDRSTFRTVWVGYDSTGGFLIQRTFIKFAIGSIPPGSLIQSANLYLSLAATTSEDSPLPVHVRRITDDWSESANWNNQPTQTVEDGVSVNIGTDFKEYNWDVKSLVQEWLGDQRPTDSIGFLLTSIEGPTQRERAFWSKDCPPDKCNDAQKPRLVIVYAEPSPTPIPPTATNTPTPALEQFSEKSQDITSSIPSKNLYYPIVVRNWPSGNAGSSQWSHIILSNPSAETAQVTLTVWGATTYDTIQAGSKLKEYSISIPPHGTYSSYNDENWRNMPDTYSQEGTQTIGTLSISSNVAISGINRWQMRKGDTFDGTSEQLSDTPLIANLSSSLHSPLVVRNWASGKEGYTQWSDIMLFNPNTDAIDVSFSIFHETEEKNGLLLKRFNKTIPGHGWLNTYNMEEWKNLEATDTTAQIKAAVSITGPIDKPFVGISRWKLIQGTDSHTNPTISTTDTPLLAPENKLFYPLALRNWPSGNAGHTQWTDLLLYNPNNQAVSIQIKTTENSSETSGSTGSVTIPPHGYYGTYGKNWLAFPRQANEPDQTNANVSIQVSGIYGIVGIARWRLVAGNAETGLLQSLSDTPLMGESKVNEVAFPLIARGIPTGIEGKSLWNDVAIFNPSNTPNTITFKMYSSREGNSFKNGSVLRIFKQTIAPHSYLNTYGLGQWHALPTNNADPGFSQTSMIIQSESPVYSIERMRYLSSPPPHSCQEKPKGDANCDDKINLQDFEEVRKEYGATSIETVADFDNNGSINLKDFEIWRKNFN